MSNQVLLIELTTLIQEAKRKSPDIRTAAEKSLQELRGLPSTSEQQLAADLSRRPTFIDPFLAACATRNARFAGSAIVCLQRLVIIRGLPKSRLKDVLEAFNACISLGLDIQLKILQALPALAQNYADDLKGEQLASALQVCAALQNVKTATVSGVAAATLQQLIISLFEKVAAEDRSGADVTVVARVPGDDGSIALREAAYDAYRVFLDLCLVTEGRKTRFVQLSTLPLAAGLELIWACLNTHPNVFGSHAELIDIVRKSVMPFLIRLLSDRQGFAITLRAVRIVSLVLQQHLDSMLEECETALGLLTHMLDLEAAASWKRILCMETFRAIYSVPGLALRIYMRFDAQEGRKAVIRDNIASFVRISSEKPSIIGLAQQSSIPAGPSNFGDTVAEQAVVDATGGVAGVIGSAFNTNELNVPGISSQWSVPKTQCLDHLDKGEAPPLPETYVYSLVLECLNSLSENLAKTILPLTVQHEDTTRDKVAPQPQERTQDGGSDNGALGTVNRPRTRSKRSQSYRSRTVPVNPLTLEHISSASRVKAIADLLEDCWPALLATSSTFLYAALDNDYYRALIRSFQRFAQVAGLLRLSTARDAFLTTLGKAAVPPNIMSSGAGSVPSSPRTDSGSVFSNPKGLLSVDSFASQSSGPPHSRRPSQEPKKTALTTRNLLCLRALLNIAIAIGPTLENSFSIVLETLHRADILLSVVNSQTRDALGTEIPAVEAAASRLFESTADYPNDAFMFVLAPLSNLLESRQEEPLSPQAGENVPPWSPPRHRQPSSGHNAEMTAQAHDYMLVLSKLGQLSNLNVARFASYPASDSGWRMLSERLVALSISSEFPKDGRRLAADIVCRCSVSLAQMSTSDSASDIDAVQRMALSTLQFLINSIYAQDDELAIADIEIHNRAIEATKSILESCGDALVAGWDIVLAITGSVFHGEHDSPTPIATSEKNDQAHGSPSSELISPVLGRSAFAIIQLICSDFLESLPSASLGPLVQLLYHFASQEADLNISLTTIALFFNVSDSLVGQDSVTALNLLAGEMSFLQDEDVYKQVVRKSESSRPAQWMFLLYRLSDVVLDGRAEVGNGAFQTLLRIFQNQGDQFSIPTWQLCFQALLLRILQEDSGRQQRTKNLHLEDATSLDQTSRNLLEGTAALISQNLTPITQMKRFPGLWTDLVQLLERYLALHSSVVNYAVYTALATVLRSVASATGEWQTASQQAAASWAAHIPITSVSSGRDAEQDAYIAYTDSACELYRLLKLEFTDNQIKSIATNLFQCVQQSRAASYGGDANTITLLQARVLDCLRSLRTDLDGVASTFIHIAAEAVVLPYHAEQKGSGRTRPSFVAFSKASMEWLASLLTVHVVNPDIFLSGAVIVALKSLVVPITSKYDWKQNGRAPPPWQKATSTALQVLRRVLEQMAASGVMSQSGTDTWIAIVEIARGIMRASLEQVDLAASIVMIEEDEDFDSASLRDLRDMIIPMLGETSLPDSVRVQYASSLFQASIIHATEPNEIPEPGSSPLANIHNIRFGRVWDPSPSPRESMSYLCFAELISMAAASDGSEQRVKLAEAAAPYLMLRFALPIKAYLADQPLRGSMPQPLSQAEELLFCLQEMKKLMCEPAAMTVIEDECRVPKGPRAHIVLLYPLIVQAIGVAGHTKHGDKEVLAALQDVLQVAAHVAL